METAIVIVVIAVSHVMVVHTVLRKLGVGRLHGKPDCGCGTCATKHRGKPR